MGNDSDRAPDLRSEGGLRREPTPRALRLGHALVESTGGGGHHVDQRAFEGTYRDLTAYIGPAVRQSVRRDAARFPDVIRVLGKDDADAEDLVQEVLVKISREIQKRGISSDPRFAADRVKTWIMSQVSKQHRARLRHKRRVTTESYDEPIHGSSNSHDGLRGVDEAKIDLRVIADRLPWPQRYVLGLWIISDGRMGEVAEAMGTSKDVARRLFQEALEAARGRPSDRPGRCLGRSILIHGVAHVAMPVGADSWFTDRSRVTVGKPVQDRGVALVRHVPSTLIVASADRTVLVPILSASRRPGKGARGGSLLHNLDAGRDVHVVGTPGDINIWW